MILVDFFLLVKIFLNRHRVNYLKEKSRISANQVNLHWWKVPGSMQNIGDFLSPVVVEYMHRATSRTAHSSNGTIHLLAIGSVIDQSYQNSVVWGSGLMCGNRKLWWRNLRKLDIRAVRGPETRRSLIENGYSCPEIYGDPAILMPLVYMPESLEKKYDYRVIQHHSFAQNVENCLSPIVKDWQQFIDELVKCRLVISSSLHGIILAEAYGIPAIMLKTALNTFKFDDYYHSTGRYDYPMADSVEQALQMEPPTLPDLEPLRQNIMAAFPADLWKS